MGVSRTSVHEKSRSRRRPGATPAYFLGDALGSVRQLANASGAVTLTRSYQPYGTVLSSAGTGTSNYAFAGEWQDATGLIHLRARYYGSSVGTLHHGGYVGGRLPPTADAESVELYQWESGQPQ
jgi:RHS repeat-associated protein